MHQEYLQKLRMRRLSPKTIELYEIEIRTLERFNRNKEAIENHLSRCAATTHARKLVIWKSYLSFKKDKLLDAFESPIIRKKLVSFLSEAEIQKVEAYSKEHLDDENQLFISIAIGLGLRLSEILGLKSEHVQGSWLLISRKGGGQQRLPLSEYLEQKLIGFKGFIRGRRYYQDLIRKLGEKCGIERRISPHTFRHTFATRALSNGFNIVLIKEFLGHQSLATTEKYLHVAPNHLIELVERKIK